MTKLLHIKVYELNCYFDKSCWTKMFFFSYRVWAKYTDTHTKHNATVKKAAQCQIKKQ